MHQRRKSADVDAAARESPTRERIAMRSSSGRT
jgi:hypothetical protein